MNPSKFHDWWADFLLCERPEYRAWRKSSPLGRFWRSSVYHGLTNSKCASVHSIVLVSITSVCLLIRINHSLVSWNMMNEARGSDGSESSQIPQWRRYFQNLFPSKSRSDIWVFENKNSCCLQIRNRAQLLPRIHQSAIPFWQFVDAESFNSVRGHRSWALSLEDPSYVSESQADCDIPLRQVWSVILYGFGDGLDERGF